jgi:hypothetical protein
MKARVWKKYPPMLPQLRHPHADAAAPNWILSEEEIETRRDRDELMSLLTQWRASAGG